MNQEILEKLLQFTDEEKLYLNGGENSGEFFSIKDGQRVMSSESLLKEGRLIDLTAHARFSRCPPHTHNYVEVVYQCMGETTHIINGKQLVLRTGELLFLPQESMQEILPAGEGDIAVNFIILPSFFENPLQFLGNEITPLRQFIIHSLRSTKSDVDYLHFEVSDVVPVQNLVDTLIWSLYNNISDGRHINEYTMGLLLLHLVNFSYKLSHSSTHDELIFKTLQYIEKNYIEGSLSELADSLGYNMTTLSTEIHKRTGRTYLELVHEKRISQACFLLQNTALSVSQIAFEIGYNNSSFFHRLFKNSVGVSPKKFRSANTSSPFGFSLFQNKKGPDNLE